MHLYHNVKKATLWSSKIILEDQRVAFLRFKKDDRIHSVIKKWSVPQCYKNDDQFHSVIKKMIDSTVL